MSRRFAKTPATLDEIKTRVFYALQRHPLCRDVEFDIVSMPRTQQGQAGPSTCVLGDPGRAVGGLEIVADIQEAYDLARRGLILCPFRRDSALFPPIAHRFRRHVNSLIRHPVFVDPAGMERF